MIIINISNIKMPYKTEIAIAFLGNVDSGKSTLIATLLGFKDDGNGSARKYVAKYVHEINSGQTSAISTMTYKINNQEAITFIDLCGHEKYFKTTAYGVMSQYPDYGVIVVSASRGEDGITKMTQEHIRLLISQRIPLLIVITRIDAIAKGVDIEVYKNTVKKLSRFIKSLNNKNTIVPINKLTDYETNFLKKNIDLDHEQLSTKIYEHLELDPDEIQTNFPAIIVSNLDQFGIETIKKSFSKLKPRDFWEINKERVEKFNQQIPPQIRVEKEDFKGSIFYITDTYKPVGLDIVVSGINRGDDMSVDQKMWIGPINNKFLEASIKSIRNNLNVRTTRPDDGREVLTDVEEMNIQKISHHGRGCLQIKIKDDGNTKIKKKDIKKGTVLISLEEMKNKFYYRFKACIDLDSDVTIRNGYTPVMNMSNIKESIKLKMSDENYKDNFIIEDRNIILNKEKPYIFDCKCISKPIYMLQTSTFIIVSGNIRGRGMILEGCPIISDDKPLNIKKNKK